MKKDLTEIVFVNEGWMYHVLTVCDFGCVKTSSQRIQQSMRFSIRYGRCLLIQFPIEIRKSIITSV